MPTLYRKNFRKSNKRGPQIARGLALDAHPKSRWALDEPDFQDHAPNQHPRRLGEVANKVVDETGEKAVHHWLSQAAQAENDEERATTLSTAQKVAKALGLTLEDFLFGRAA